MTAGPPSRIDRAALERILRRATELQVGGSESGAETLSEDEVVALGREVGIPEAQLRQAILEDRIRPRPAPTTGWLDHLTAPAEFVAERVVAGQPADLMTALTAWLADCEHLVPQRSSATQAVFEPMPPWAGTLKSIGSMIGGRATKPYLDKANQLQVSITPLEDGFCHIGLRLSMRTRRNAFVGGGVAMFTSNLAAAAVILVMGAPASVGLIPILVGAGGGFAIARSWKGGAQRAQVGLERALDVLEVSSAKPSPTNEPGPGESRSTLLGREVGGAVRDFTREVRKVLEQ